MTMDRDRLAQALMATFLEELEGHVATLNRDLLALEKVSTSERADELMTSLLRTVHSVKGASRAVNLGLVETACHWLEEVLLAVRSGDGAVVCLVLLAQACRRTGWNPAGAVCIGYGVPSWPRSTPRASAPAGSC